MGVADYDGLLGWITDPSLRSIAASYYEEFHLALDARAWVSSCVLAGAVLEAILLNQLPHQPGKPTLGELISSADGLSILSGHETQLASELAACRNKLHPGNAAETGAPERSTAMRAAVLLEGMVDRFGR